ncbi:MAG TPA: methyltransferase domain-containing protein [Gaiellaceae bacterium]|nr:methyltransferase domain-containing protein [Gaiellaceae bacterium]
MSACCARHGQDELFNERTARRDAARYRRRGADPMARSLARRAAARGVEGASVLEIGGGIGQVALELLRRGAARAEVVELLPAYEPFVHELAAEQGLGDRMSFRTADLVSDRAAGSPVDLVVLNKVVCCTPDGVELAGIAASLARRTLALSHPRETWFVRVALGAVNLYLRARRRHFRVFVHAARELEAAVAAHGLVLASERDGPLFRVAAFERV